MSGIFASTYEITNGVCYIDGIAQSSTDACTEGIKQAAGLAGVFLIPIILIAIAITVMWIMSLIHVITHEDVPNRVLWIVLHFVGLNGLAGPVYLLAVKRPYDKRKLATANTQPPQTQPQATQAAYAPEQPAITTTPEPSQTPTPAPSAQDEPSQTPPSNQPQPPQAPPAQ